MAKDGDQKDFLAVLQKFVGAKLKNVHTAYPAKLIAYDAVTQKATIQHSIQFKFKGKDKAESYANIIDVPVVIPRGGDYINFSPIKKGDLGLAIVAEQSLNSWAYSKGNPTFPDEERMFDLSDSCWIPGLYPFGENWEGSIPENAAGIQVKSGTKLSFGNGTDELLDLLHQVITLLSTETVTVTTLGVPAPLLGAADYVVLAGKLENLKV